MLDAVALALGDLARSEPPTVLKRRWPACIVVAVVQITARYDKTGKVWPAWFRATRTRAAHRCAADWAEAFVDSLATLGVPVPAGNPLETVLAHAAVTDPARTAADTPKAGPGPLRLDPFGRGVLTRDADPDAGRGQDHAGSWTAISPAEVTEPADPLLAFDADGEQIAAVLPPEAVWLVYPQDRALRADPTPGVLVESRLPLAWNGWRLVQLDLAGVGWLALEPAPGSAPRRHPVRGRSRPRLVTGVPVPGIHTPDGLPVFGTLPLVRLLLGEIRWRVEVRRSGSGPVLAAVEASGDRWEPGRLWYRTPRPVLGELAVTVTALGAPQAAGLRRTVAIAGLQHRLLPGAAAGRIHGPGRGRGGVPRPRPIRSASPRAAMIPGPRSTASRPRVGEGPWCSTRCGSPARCGFQISPRAAAGWPTAWPASARCRCGRRT